MKWILRDSMLLELIFWFKFATKQSSLNLSGDALNRLTTLPDSIGNLSELTKVDLYFNNLTRLPESIGKLTNLNWLSLSNNQLNSLPDSIGNLSQLTYLNLAANQLTSLPDSIGNLTNLTSLELYGNKLTNLPENIGNLSSLSKDLLLWGNQLTSLPDSIGNLTNLTKLSLTDNQLASLPDSIGSLFRLTELDLSYNRLNSLPDSIGDLSKLEELYIHDNQLINLPFSMEKLAKLRYLNLSNNPLTDLSSLQNLNNLEVVIFLGVTLPRRYWTKFSEWKSEWLLVEDNAEIKRILIEKIGYERICDELNAVTLDYWREYRLLKIGGVERIYGWGELPEDIEPMILLKMTCPSTNHIHILRVPPEMTSAEAAITWVNHGIHPDEFAIQT